MNTEGGTRANPPWSSRNAATSRVAPSPTLTPCLMPGTPPSPPAAAPDCTEPRCFLGLFTAYGSSSSGLNTPMEWRYTPSMKYEPPVETWSVSLGAMPRCMASVMRPRHPCTTATTRPRALGLPPSPLSSAPSCRHADRNCGSTRATSALASTGLSLAPLAPGDERVRLTSGTGSAPGLPGVGDGVTYPPLKPSIAVLTALSSVCSVATDSQLWFCTSSSSVDRRRRMAPFRVASRITPPTRASSLASASLSLHCDRAAANMLPALLWLVVLYAAVAMVAVLGVLTGRIRLQIFQTPLHSWHTFTPRSADAPTMHTPDAWQQASVRQGGVWPGVGRGNVGRIAC